ncbi:MAG TPA: hypothetical protein RMH99_05525 [Sandaracinaceae bacterium LLY-WYZ-13_1]|nr:hypothetical protein [Sandaracinaceae bacterium LLY-WYZ-13_1]
MSYPDFLLDKRVVERNIAKGLVDRKEYEKHLGALPDVEDNAEACTPDEPEEAAEGEAAEAGSDEG